MKIGEKLTQKIKQTAELKEGKAETAGGWPKSVRMMKAVVVEAFSIWLNVCVEMISKEWVSLKVARLLELARIDHNPGELSFILFRFVIIIAHDNVDQFIE